MIRSRRATRAARAGRRRSKRRRAGPDGQATRLAGALQALARGLPNPWDESTDYFRGFVAAAPGTAKVDAAAFRAALRIGTRYHVELSGADAALAALGKPGDDRAADLAAGFRLLAQVMRATLTERCVAFARGKGVVRVRVWLFGRTADGTLVGLRSLSTET